MGNYFWLIDQNFTFYIDCCKCYYSVQSKSF